MKQPIPFGKYYLLERINVGGMAEVFRAKAYGVEGFERLVAVKRILPNIAEDKEFIEMFIDEAKIAVQLNHANIAQIFDLGKVDDSFFIALEYVHGKDLRAIFDRCVEVNKPMPVSQACFIVMKICEGLDYAHNKRGRQGEEMHLVHRDVSPQNILLSYEGEVKLVDFGIAKAAGKASKTQAGILKGKFGYMSPEQVRGLPLDRRSDIFSVGIVLYEILTGERLFLGESDFSTLEKVRNVEILPPSTYNRRIGEELEQIVLKALAKDVEERYQNAIDLHDDLQAYMYTSGDFYSRKDLASWMKQTFVDDIEQEAKKIESYRRIPVPPIPSSQTAETRGGGPAVVAPPPTPISGGNGQPADMALPRGAPSVDFPEEAPATLGEDPAAAAEPMSWDEEEIETQIYDKPSSSAPDLSQAVDGDAPDEGEEVVETAERRLPVATGAMPTVEPTQPVAGGGRGWIWGSLVVVLAFCGAALYYFGIRVPRPGSLTVQTVPDNAEVFVDDRPRGSKSPVEVHDLQPGSYILEIRKRGYEPWKETVEIRSNEIKRVTAQLALVATGTVELHTRPKGGVAFLDGQRLTSVTPMRIAQIPPGRHRIEVRKKGFQPLVEEFDIQPEQTLKLSFKLLPPEVPVKVSSKPRGEVFLVRDGNRERLGRTPIELKLDPKRSHRLLIRREGYRDWSEAVVFDGDEPVTIKAELERDRGDRSVSETPRVALPVPLPKPAPTKKPAKPKPRPPKVATAPPAARPKPAPRPAPKPAPKPRPAPKPKPAAPKPKPKPEPPKFGVLSVGSRPAARILIDGKDTGLFTPQLRIKLRAGKHRVTLTNPKFKVNETFTVVVRPDQPTKLVKNFLK